MERYIYYCVMQHAICILLTKWRPSYSNFISLILQSNSSCIIYHFVAKQLTHLLWYSIPYQINSTTSYFPTKGKICDFRRTKSISYNVISDTRNYSIVWKILLNKWMFGWLMLSSIASTREERYKTAYFYRIFIICTRRQWNSNQDSYLLELPHSGKVW